jgi:hypothetical protein
MALSYKLTGIHIQYVKEGLLLPGPYKTQVPPSKQKQKTTRRQSSTKEREE